MQPSRDVAVHGTPELTPDEEAIRGWWLLTRLTLSENRSCWLLAMKAYAFQRMISEACRTGRAASWYGNSPDRAVFAPPRRMRGRPPVARQPRRVDQTSRRRQPRSRQPRRSNVRTQRQRARAPGSSDESDPEPDLTPLEQAFAAFLAALQLAEADARTCAVFLDLAARRVAHEYARELEAA